MGFTITTPLTDLNTYIRAERGNKFAGAELKRDNTEAIMWEIKGQRVPKVTEPVFIICHWFCRDKKRDKDNIAFAKKFILDGLVTAGILKNDSWDYVLGFTDAFTVDEQHPRVEVELLPGFDLAFLTRKTRGLPASA